MTNEMMSLRTLLERSPDADVLREMIGFAGQRLMELEVGAITGAGCGENCAERLTQRNGYCERDWQTRAGTVELKIPELRKGSYFPAFLSSRWMTKKTLTMMRPPLLLAAVLLLPGVDARAADNADGVDCRQPRGRIEFLVCADREREALEREAAALHDRVLRSLDRPSEAGIDPEAARTLLSESQEAWRRLVDADCALGTALFGGGNGASAEALDCRIAHLRARIYRLRTLLHDDA